MHGIETDELRMKRINALALKIEGMKPIRFLGR